MKGWSWLSMTSDEGPEMRIQQPDREIIYIGDPMCSWCWGIAPELDALVAGHPEVPFRVVLGGLRPGQYSEEMSDEMAAMLRHHWAEVAGRSGQPFSYEILDTRGWTYDTEPACRAVVAMRQLDNSLAFPLFKRIQRAFYAEGVVTSDPAAFADLVAELGIDVASFIATFESDHIRRLTWEDFALARQWGISGFPTVVARQGAQGHLLASGYATADELDRALVNALGVTRSADLCAPGEVC